MTLLEEYAVRFDTSVVAVCASNGEDHPYPFKSNLKRRLIELLPCELTWEMEPPWMKEGLSVCLEVGMRGGGAGMLGGRLCLNDTRTASGMSWAVWLGVGCRTTERGRERESNER